MSFFPVCEDFPQIINRLLTIINHFDPVFSLETPTITQCLGGSFLPPFFCPKFTFFARSHVLGLTGKKGLLLSPFQRCSVIAQLVEQATVNRPVVGSSPTHGANTFNTLASYAYVRQDRILTRFLTFVFLGRSGRALLTPNNFTLPYRIKPSLFWAVVFVFRKWGGGIASPFPLRVAHGLCQRQRADMPRQQAGHT